jgi:saccharopine dehydrogenase (NADP+, L-glutamate forming)
MLRGTFRKPGFSKAWQVFVMLGMTDDSLQLNLPQSCTMADWLEMYLPKGEGDLKQRLKNTFLLNDEEVCKFEWLDFFSQSLLPVHSGTSAQILEEILKSRWVLGAHDRDLVVMQHQISYSKDNTSYLHESTMVIKGESNTHTAMAKTVGLPLAIACKLIIENGIKARGVITPVNKEVYGPILDELSQLGIDFKDKISVLA